MGLIPSIFLGFILLLMARRAYRAYSSSSDAAGGSLFPDGIRKPSDDFHDKVWLPTCNAIAAAAQEKLKRPLSGDERRAIWRGRSAMFLEVISREIESAAGSDEVAKLLKELPPGMSRPDPTRWCQAV